MTTLITPEPPHVPTLDCPAAARIEDSEHEIVNGQIVESQPMGSREVNIASTITILVGGFVRSHGLGRVVAEMLFILRRDPLLRRRPDVALVSAERWAMDRPVPRGEAAWDVIPDLVVEVVSPTDLASDLNGKVAEYRAAGVRRIWVVYPEQTEITECPTDRTARTYGPGDAIVGGDLLPGFALAVNEVFELN